MKQLPDGRRAEWICSRCVRTQGLDGVGRRFRFPGESCPTCTTPGVGMVLVDRRKKKDMPKPPPKYAPPPEPVRLKVGLQTFRSRSVDTVPLDTTDAMAVRFELPDGSWFDVECRIRDGVQGLCIRGSDSMGVKLGVSNAVWLIPRGGTV